MDTAKSVVAKLGPSSLVREFVALTEIGLDPSDAETRNLLQALHHDGILLWDETRQMVKVLRPDETGVVELLKSFCVKNYGLVSPLIDRKMAQAILRRHGAEYLLEDSAVQADVRRVEELGFLRVLDNDRGYFKILGN